MAIRYDAVKKAFLIPTQAVRLSVPAYFNPIFMPNYVRDSNGRLNLAHLPRFGPSRPFLYNVLHPITTTKRIFRALKAPSTVKVIEPYLIKDEPDCIVIRLAMAGLDGANVSVDGNTVFVEAEGDDNFLAKYGFKKYNCWIDLPRAYNKFRVSDIKAKWMINGGAMIITLPKLKKSFDVKVDRVIKFS